MKSIQALNPLSVYTTYLICKSTAFTTPVLYLILENNLGLPLAVIIATAAIYGLIAVALEFPTGLVGDIYGHKASILAGLACLSASFLILLLPGSILVLHAFLLLSMMAGAFFSGSDQSWLRDILDRNDYEKYRTAAFKVQGSMYLITSPLLALGVYLYSYDFRWVLIAQAAFAVMAMILIFLASPNTQDSKARRPKLKTQIAQTLSGCIKTAKKKRFLGLSFISGSFGGAVLLNHRTIQTQLTSSFSGDPLFWLALAFVIGNIASYVFSRMAKRFVSNSANPTMLILVCIVILFALFALLANDAGAVVFAAFLGVCAFKTLYRPILSAEMVRLIWRKDETATTFSAAAIIVAGVAAITQVAPSFFFEDTNVGNWVAGSTSAAVALVGLVLFYRGRVEIIESSVSSLSGKRTNLVLSGNTYRLEQIYPDYVSDEWISSVEISPRPYAHPKLLGTLPDRKTIVWSAVNGLALSKTQISPALIEAFLATNRPEFHDIDPGQSVIESLQIPEFLREKLSQRHWVGTVHGDFHPDNILVSGDELLAIDWDLTGPGYLWFDYVSLICHPRLQITPAERLETLGRLMREFNAEELTMIVISFCDFKYEQLSAMGKNNTELANIASEFRLISREVRAC